MVRARSTPQHCCRSSAAPPPSISGPLAPNASREDAERTRILEAIRQAHGNKSRVAELLGVSRKTLYARMKRLSVEH